VGLVLLLLLGSVILYLYTRMQQTEQKVGLLESILLDLKMTAEIQSYTELPADSMAEAETETEDQEDAYEPFDDADKEPVAKSGVPDKEVEEYTSVDTLDDIVDTTLDGTMDSTMDSTMDKMTNNVAATDLPSTPVQYEAMMLKDLQTLAKSRGIKGASTMKKDAVIDALKASDRLLKPGSLGVAGSSSFLETSATFSNESA